MHHSSFSQLSTEGWAPQVAKNLPASAGETREKWVPSLDWEDPLEEGMQPTPVFLPGKILWTQEPVGLQSKESDMTQVNWHTHMLLKDILSIS